MQVIKRDGRVTEFNEERIIKAITLAMSHTTGGVDIDLATKISKESIEIFNDMFGKYPYNIYSVIASDFYIGGMEYPTLSMIDEGLYTNKNKFLLEYVIAHETAHQWWYSVVGNDEVSEPWLDEALTEYSTILSFEKKYGKNIIENLYGNLK